MATSSIRRAQSSPRTTRPNPGPSQVPSPVSCSSSPATEEAPCTPTRAGGSPIYRLPPGEITNGTYPGNHIGTPGAYTIVARNLEDFLNRPRQAIADFAENGYVGDL